MCNYITCKVHINLCILSHALSHIYISLIDRSQRQKGKYTSCNFEKLNNKLFPFSNLATKIKNNLTSACCNQKRLTDGVRKHENFTLIT